MFGLGTVLNVALILAGGLFGMLFGKLIKEQMADTLTKTCGISVLFIGIAGALEGLLSVENGGVVSKNAVFTVVCLLIGALVGEIINIEGWFEKFGEWLKIKTGNAKDKSFVDGFINASFTVCIGAMAIVGSIQDGIYHDYSILLTKGILDMIIIMVMTASLGKGPLFSFIPVFLLQGSITVLSKLIVTILTDESLGYLSMIGSILIFCVGLNLVWGKKIRVANMLPAVVFAVAYAFLPFKF